MRFTVVPIILSLLASTAYVNARPLSRVSNHIKPKSSTLLTRDRPSFGQDKIDASLLRPALFSRVAYCSSKSVTEWTCGEPCEALGSVKVFLAGGDDGEIPEFFVAHDTTANTIVVAHQGTEKDSVLSIFNNLQLDLIEPNTQFFPSTAGTGIRVHEGFHKTFERTSDQILTTVQNALAETGATSVITTGHSLGGAVAILDGLMLRETLPQEISVQTRIFGNPRTGNDEWANYIDSRIGVDNFSFVTNQNDIVPSLPPTALGYRHPSGEVHIESVNAEGQAEEVKQCEGQEDEECQDGNSFFAVSVSDHRGPYFNNLSFGSSNCPF